MDRILGIICKIRKKHAWYAYEAYHGDWFLVCNLCHQVKPLTGKEAEDGNHSET